MLIIGLGLGMIIPGAAAARAATREVTLPIAEHGAIPLTATTVAGAMSGTMPDGTARTWAAVSGKPAYLAEIDPIAGDVITTYPMPDSGGAWGVEIGPDGTVWVASYGSGNLYYLPFGAAAIINAGRPHPQTSFLWQVDTDADGIAYTGTFQGFAGGSVLPPARVAAFDPKTGQYRDYGEFGAAYTYVRSTAVIGNTIYAGMGTTAALFAIDIDSGAKSEIPLPEGREGCQFTYELATSGTDLWVRFDCTKISYGYVYDTVGRAWTRGPLTGYSDQRVGRDTAGNTWFTIGSTLHRLSPDGEDTELDAAIGSKGIGVVESGGQEYVIGLTNNVLDRYDIATGEQEQHILDLPGTPTTPRSAVLGPDGRLHFGGYFSGGLASFDPAAEEWQFQARLGQTEGFATVGDRLYGGHYPGAKIEKIDPTKPLGSGNPTEVFNLTAEGQDRPFALTDAGGLLAVGTVPGYGNLQGALAIHDPATGDVDRYVGLIPDQCITALAYANGVVYGGTSVYGGNGVEPTQDNARVFAFDLLTRKLLWNVEVEGQRQVTSLEVTPGRRVWAGTKGTLHALSTVDGKQVADYEIAPFDWSTFPGGTWQGTSLAYDPSTNRLYGSIGGKVIRIRPAGRPDLQILAGTGGAHIVLAPDHRLYFVNGQNLKSIDWREAD
ncbi:PQQ-binding-like beta-propeller repeat protein [Microlunatus speluncae]|uniref:PQQ-binding-like beta-propeller repeat protein n=1 Tax=Microlunatus speluncae TaxID=2594267 RepID=UPI0012667F9E|nr:PQQ-binding-like beta-propeller repeat protein [Microlunatus speluncae]